MARKFAFDVVDVFTDRPFGGNQLAVVYEADALTSEQMHAIAAEFNFAETTFVLRPTLPEADFQVRIFTPLVELPFAGHPTVGTAVAATIRQGRLSSVAHKLVLQETVGPR
jgi:trans-2,3-dihydro-3-hydroxyanthranilate isomerase